MKQARPRSVRRLAVRAALLGGLSLTAFATAAVAQDETEDEIVVTGSRIRQNPLDASRPVLNIGSEDIERTGISNIGEILQRIPGSGGGLNSKVNSSGNFGNPPDGGGVGAGASEIDLRFLSSRRVLVLVDGLRWVNGSSASGVPGATDLNTIPTSIIDRVELLQDGASPIYGSDAIAGVVNIITKRSQEGFAASAQLGAFDKTDGETQQYDISFGAGNDRTQIFFAAQYVHQNGVSSADRDISDFPEPTLDECFVTCSSATPRGRFLFTDPNTLQALNITLNENFVFSGANPVYDPLNPTGADFEPFTTADRFNFAPFNFLQIPSERFGFFTQVTHEVTDNINFRAKAAYNTRNSTNQAAPIPLFIGPEAGNGNRLDNISVDVTNPFNPFGFSLTPANTVFLARRFLEAGPRNFQQNVDTFYASATLDGSFNVGGREVFWDVNSLWSQNEANQIARGIVNSARLEQALGPVANCTGSCVPFNFFGGPGSITQDQVNFVTFNQQDSSQQELWDLSFNLSTTLFDLPAGGVGIAAGFEHRDQSGSFNPDPIVAAGDSADIPAQPTSGAFNVEEIYAETVVPLLADLPLVKILEGNFAIRYSDYSTGVSATTIKYGGRWKPFDDLTLRGGFTEGFRAASIGELFGTATRFDATLEDPCSDFLGLFGGPVASPALQANCISLGVPADGSYEQTNPQISTLTGGNPGLAPETSKGWNVGFTYAPAWLEAFNAVYEFNYYRINIDGAIQALDAQLQLDSCAATLDPTLCASIGRAASGTIISFSNQLTNIGRIETSGLDWSVGFAVDAGSAGRFTFQSLSNYLLDYTEANPTSTGFIVTSREGTVRGSPTFSFPEFKSTATLAWTLGDFRLQGVGRYISSLTETCGDQAALPADVGCSRPADDINDLGARFYLDLAASYTLPWLDKRTEFTIGVNNILDTDPPNCFSCQLNGFDPNTYDVPGQFGYVRLTWRP